MENTRESRIEYSRAHAMSEDVRLWLDEMDAERAFETDAELDEAEDAPHARETRAR
jgi:hypothetical protein